jgi:hypothetical protein
LAEDSALCGGDGLSVESADLIGGAGAKTSQDAGGENRREVADRRVVVQLALHDEPTVLGGHCGVGLPGQVGGHAHGWSLPPGDQVAFLKYDPDSMRVWRAGVQEVVQEDIDSWRIETTHGAEVVNREGEGASLVPMDEQVATEIVQKGTASSSNRRCGISSAISNSPGMAEPGAGLERTLGRDGHER